MPWVGCRIPQKTMADPQSRPLGPAAAAGFVFVSTDATGTIRVFRSDIPEEIREKTLLKLEEYKAVFGNSSGGGSGTGCKLLRRSSSTFLGIASPGTNRFHCHLIRVKNSTSLNGSHSPYQSG